MAERGGGTSCQKIVLEFSASCWIRSDEQFEALYAELVGAAFFRLVA